MINRQICLGEGEPEQDRMMNSDFLIVNIIWPCTYVGQDFS